MRTNRNGARALVIAAAIGLPCVMLNCTGDQQPTIDGATALGPFKQGLMRALQTGLNEGGPTEAMTACNVQAPGIAEANSIDGIKVGRTSHKLRNQDNAPSAWVAPVLDEYVNDPMSREPRTIDLGIGRIGYVEPITIMSMCLPCHGEAIGEDVSAILTALYPDDQAIGFKEGDFRGVFWLEYAPD